MRGDGASEAKGFWADAWSRVLKRRAAIAALCWISFVGFFAVFAPIIANGHPLMMWELDAAGKRTNMSLPLFASLRTADWLLLLGAASAFVFLILPVRAPRSERFGIVFVSGLQAGLTAALAAAVKGYFGGRSIAAWARQLQQSEHFVAFASAGVTLFVALLFLAIPSARTLLRRVLLVAVTALICGLVINATWNRPPDRFDYAQLSREGKIDAVYTLVPWSPAQRPSDRDAKILPPGSSSDTPLERVVTVHLPGTGELSADDLALVHERLSELPLSKQQAHALNAALDAQFPDGTVPTRTKLRDFLTLELNRMGHQYVLGTDGMGQDVLSQMIHACRLSVSIGLVSTGIAVLIGVTMGALMGYFGGFVDLFLYRVVEIFMAVPVLFLLILAAGVLPRSTYMMMAIIGCFTWHSAARFTRAEFLKLRNMDFVQSAKAVGLPLRSILFKHMLPNGVTPVLVDASFLIAAAILAEATLSYLGLGPPDQASWGKLLASATREVGGFIWWLAIFPGFVIFLTVLSYNLLGESLRDAIDPRLRKARV